MVRSGALALAWLTIGGCSGSSGAKAGSDVDAGGDTGKTAAGYGTGVGGTGGQRVGGGAGGALSGGGRSAGGTASGQGGTPPAASAGAAGYAALPEPVPAIDCQHTGDGLTTVVIVNHCSAPLEARGSNWVGAHLDPGRFTCVDVGSDIDPISGYRYWGYLGQDPGGEHYTLAEFTFNTDFNDFDWWDISHVDAHNLPMQIIAVDEPQCRTLTCAQSLLAGCPAVGQSRDSTGTVTSCVSPERDNPDSPVALYFDQACGDAYSWSGDDADSMVACAAEDFDVIFCP